MATGATGQPQLFKRIIEVIDMQTDPNEWTNLATEPQYAAQKAEMAKFLPTTNKKDIGGTGGGEEGETKKEKPSRGSGDAGTGFRSQSG